MEQPLGGLKRGDGPDHSRVRSAFMNMLLLIVGAVVLAGLLFTISSMVNRRNQPPGFIDKDADGEPDEPGGPAKDL